MRLFLLLAVLLIATRTYAQDNIILRNGEEIFAKVLEISQTDLKYRKTTNPDGPIYTSPLRDVLLIKYANGTKDTFGKPTAAASANPTYPAGSGTSVATATNLDGLRYHRGLFSRYYVGGNGQRIGLSEANTLFNSQPDALMAFDKGRSLRTWSRVTAIPAVLLIGSGIGIMAVNGRHMGRNGRDNDPDRNGTPIGNQRNGNRRVAIVGAAMAGTGALLGAASLWLDSRATMQFRRAANRYTNRQTATLRFGQNDQGLGASLTF